VSIVTDDMVEAAARAVFMLGWEMPRGFANDDDFFRERKKWNAEEWDCALSDARAALAAVAPLIAAAERDACAEAARAVAMQWREQINTAATNGQRTTFADREAGAMTALAAIRARGTTP
jgi:inorganic triphosphatase YgiF